MEIRDRVRELRRVRAGDLVPHPRNWRTHGDAQRRALRDVLGAVGYADALLVRETGDGRLALIDGHLRAEETPDAVVPVLVLDLTAEEADYLLVTLDPLAGMAGSDPARLADLMAEIDLESEALEAVLQGHLSAAPPAAVGPGAGGGEFDATPEESGPTRTAAGEVWVIGGRHRLAVGDCTDAATVAQLMAGARVGLCFTSPPYNAGDSELLTNNSHTTDTKYVLGGKDRLDPQGYKDLLHRFTRNALDWCGLVVVNVQSLAGNKVPLIEYLHEFRHHFADVAVWVKDTPQPAMARRVMTSAFEYLLFLSPDENPTRAVGSNDFRGTVPNVYHGPAHRGNEFSAVHAATFPLHLPTWVLSSFGTVGETVYDPFLGTGTTLVAAHRLGRTCYGCELEPRYADVILKRAEAEGLTCERGD